MVMARNIWKNTKTFIGDHKIFSALVVLELLIVIAFGWFLATRQEISTTIPLDISTEAEKKTCAAEAEKMSGDAETENNGQNKQKTGQLVIPVSAGHEPAELFQHGEILPSSAIRTAAAEQIE